MPRYFFHLSFGDRPLPDEEGVELPSRSAARQEAQAVVRELSGSPANRWAIWFLRVADLRGEFLNLPLGHPALQLVGNDRLVSNAPSRSPEIKEAYGRRRATALTERAEVVFAEAVSLRRRTSQLVERNRQLRAALLSVLVTCRAGLER